MAPRTQLATEGTQSLRRAIGLLRVLSTHMTTGWRLSDLAERTGLDHATVHRLLAGLAQDRLVTRVGGTRRYTLGPLAYELGVASARYFDLDRVCAERLKKLAAETRDTSSSTCAAARTRCASHGMKCATR